MPEYKQQWRVPSSDGQRTYTVSLTVDGQWQCACIGWTRKIPRRDCRHVKGIKSSMSAQQSPRKTGLKLDAERNARDLANERWADKEEAKASAMTAKAALKAGASKEEAADVARVKREEVQAKKDAKLGKMRYGFQLAKEWHVGDALPSNMVAEVKYDGHLAMLISGRIINRSGRDITNRFPEIMKVSGAAVLVGELIIPDAQGLGDFSTGIQERNTDSEMKIRVMAAARPAMFIAFDILESVGEDITNLSLRQRRAILETFYRHARPARHKLIAQESVQGKADVLRLLERERTRNGEGIMVKDLDARYTAKRGRAWLKVKTWQDREFNIVSHGPTGIGDGYAIVIRNKGREQTVNLGSHEMRQKVRAGHKRVEIKFLSESDDGALRFPSVRRLI